MKIELIEEFSLDASQRESIGQLLAESFTDFPQSRTYSKQSPHWRLLATEGDRLLGQLGLDHRMIGTTFEVETDKAGEAPVPFCSETVRRVVVAQQGACPQ